MPCGYILPGICRGIENGKSLRFDDQVKTRSMEGGCFVAWGQQAYSNAIVCSNLTSQSGRPNVHGHGTAFAWR
jgi:hypothetical protein